MSEEDRTIAILRDEKGLMFTVPAIGVRELILKLRDYAPEQLVEVWRGKRLILLEREDAIEAKNMRDEKNRAAVDKLNKKRGKNEQASAK